MQDRPADLLGDLIRFDTTNPPGHEAACIAYVRGLLEAAGLDCVLLARTPERPNLLTRLRGAGAAPPLLVYGHVDVVPTEGQRWSHPPFAGDVADGFLWGRGALDMKGGVAMMLAAVLQLQAAGVRPAGDVVLAVLSDEEAGGNEGAKFLVEEHAGRFAGIRYALGEFGGFTLSVGGRRFYPIQVSEKQLCTLRITVRGAGGHGAFRTQGGAMARIARVLLALDEAPLPVHVLPSVRRMCETMAAAVDEPLAGALRALVEPATTDRALAQIGPLAALFDPMFHHVANATMVRGGVKINVIPSEVAIDLDGRLLPGFGPDDLVAELRARLGPEPEIDLVRYDQGAGEPDMGLFDLLGGVLRAADRGAIPIPFLLPAVTDGRFFSRLGIQTYGFTPMQLPAGFNFLQTIHAADERIPLDAVEFGTRAIRAALEAYGRA
ncbi:MAG: M20/M25/M40 family metallo-hydrolase [Acidobacteriota bacterium]|nr:M20/M25/M40 family metallo-hydrolase [Acidobacteriota bacterium]